MSVKRLVSCSPSQPMKFIFLLWITIRGIFDASVWATAVWCILGYFSNVLWLQCFGISIAIHLIRNWPFVEYVRVHTKQDCLIYMRRESTLVGFAIMLATLISILPTVAAIILLSLLQVWTHLETHWLHTWLFVACVVYNLSRSSGARRMAVLSNDFLRSHRGFTITRTHPAAGAVVENVVEQPHCEERVGSQESFRKVARSAQNAANGSRARVIDV
jgi:hypothetical protein